jgi:hypothetical protein
MLNAPPAKDLQQLVAQHSNYNNQKTPGLALFLQRIQMRRSKIRAARLGRIH